MERVRTREAAGSPWFISRPAAERHGAWRAGATRLAWHPRADPQLKNPRLSKLELGDLDGFVTFSGRSVQAGRVVHQQLVDKGLGQL